MEVMPADLETRAASPVCELCGGAETEPPYQALPKIHRCRACGLVFQFPQPDMDRLREIYSDRYFVSASSSDCGYDHYVRDEPNIRATFQRRFRSIERFHPGPGRLLDVGCTAGFFLKVARENGWETAGIEISAYAASHAKGLDLAVFEGTLDDFPPPARPFDVITLWDVLEHLKSPRAALLHLNFMMSTGGHLVLAVPVIDSLPAMFFRERWMGFKEEEHLFFLSRRTLRRLLGECGFSVCFEKLEGKHVSLDLLKRRIGCYSRFLSDTLRRVILPRLGRSFNFYINPLDICLVVASKRS
jgi:SAM-dependent methyltransferase